MTNLTYHYDNGPTVPGLQPFLPKNNTIVPAYWLGNGTLCPAGYYGNLTVIPVEDCTFDTCNLNFANVLYVPSLSENVALAAIFGLLAVAQIPLGIRYKTWGFMVAELIGMALEVIGYVGRIMMNDNVFTQGPFIIYLCCLTIAPAFLSAGIYLCLARIISVYGQHLARFRPFVYTVVFMVSDFFSLVLQGAGGGIASTADQDDTAMRDAGVNTMIAGLVFQVLSLLIFMLFAADFAFQAYKHKDQHVPQFSVLRSSLKFKAFLAGLSLATLTIFVRSVYRVAELQAGFDSALANNQGLFLGLEGIMVVLACISLTALHPGLVYGKENWAACNFKMTQKKGAYSQHKNSPSLSDTEMLPTSQRQ